MREQTLGVTLTQSSDHLIDFTRVAERISSSASWIPSYSAQEIMSRLFVAISTVAAGCLGYQRSSQDLNCVVKTGAAAFAGFFVSHLLVILPLIKKRIEMKQECMECAREIKEKFKNNAEVLSLLESVIEKILVLSFVENGRAQASLTWGRRGRLMKVLYRQLHSVDLNDESHIELAKTYFNALLAAEDFLRELAVRKIELHLNNQVVPTAARV